MADQPSIAARPLMAFVRLYQCTLAHVLGGQCRFQPTCSHYALEALRTHGALRGGWLSMRRLLRCHPWGPSGEDPVPPASTKASSASAPRPLSPSSADPEDPELGPRSASTR